MSSQPYISVPMLPGPVTVPDSVLEIMCRDYGTDYFDEAYLELYKATGKNLATLAETANDVVIMTGEGMLGLWAALKSSLKPGDRVLSVGTGLFGDGLGQMAASLGCEVKPYSLSYNQTIGQAAPGGGSPRLGGGDSPDLDQIEDAVRKFKPKMITAVHPWTDWGKSKQMPVCRFCAWTLWPPGAARRYKPMPGTLIWRSAGRKNACPRRRA